MPVLPVPVVSEAPSLSEGRKAIRPLPGPTHDVNLADAGDGVTAQIERHRASRWLAHGCQLALRLALPCLGEASNTFSSLLINLGMPRAKPALLSRFPLATRSKHRLD